MPKLSFSNYEGGREHAYIKHYLLERYLSRWAPKTASKWDPLVFVDGFAGPWGAKDADFSDASFGIAIRSMNDAVRVLRTLGRTTHGICIFVEKDEGAFARLEAFTKKHSADLVRARAFKGSFAERIADIEQYVATVGENPFKLVFLDQMGWDATPMDKLKGFVSSRSCELFFNLMTSFLTRFLDHPDLSSSYERLYGRPGVVEALRALPTNQREQAAVDEYCKSLQLFCGFQYLSQAVIMDADKERIRYFFVFATNSIHGIEVFKEAEAAAATAQDEVRHATRLKKRSQLGLPFSDGVPKTAKLLKMQEEYVERLKIEIVARLSTTKTRIWSYDELYGKSMTLPLVNRTDLDRVLHWLKPNVQVQLQGENRRKAGLHKGDQVIVDNRHALSKVIE